MAFAGAGSDRYDVNEMLIKSPGFALILGLSMGLSGAQAQSFDSVITPQIGGTFVSDSFDSAAGINYKIRGLRLAGRLEFMNVTNHVAITLLSSFTSSYYDFGAQLRVFNYRQLTRLKRAMFFYGLGAGAIYSPGFSDPGGADKKPFTDIVTVAFVRLQWELNSRSGFFTEFAYEPALLRHYETGSARRRGAEIHRFALIAGMPFSVDD